MCAGDAGEPRREPHDGGSGGKPISLLIARAIRRARLLRTTSTPAGMTSFSKRHTASAAATDSTIGFMRTTLNTRSPIPLDHAHQWAKVLTDSRHRDGRPRGRQRGPARQGWPFACAYPVPFDLPAQENRSHYVCETKTQFSTNCVFHGSVKGRTGPGKLICVAGMATDYGQSQWPEGAPADQVGSCRHGEASR